MTRFVLVFLLCVGILFPLDLVEPVERHVILPFTALLADVSVWLIQLFDTDAVATSNIIRSQSTGFAISIERGCNGLEAVIILVSAIIAFPAPWRYRAVGIGLGFLAIQAVNLVRIISLFYLGQWSRLWFEWFHLYLWQALIVLDALVVFLVWLRYMPRAGRPAALAPAA